VSELPRDRIYVGIAGHVAALDALTGREVWRTKLKGRGFVTTGIAGDRVIAATSGRLFALDPTTGALLWQNELKGLGLGLVSVPGIGASPVVNAAALEADRRQRAAAAT
jgi:outer membrane protein assembly factor BamB